MREPELPVVIPSTCVCLEFIRARKYRMIVRAADCSDELARECLHHSGDAQRILIAVTELPLHIEPKGVHFPAI